MIKYGLISETDGRTLEKTLDLIFKEFPLEDVHLTEIGLFDGGTARGLREYILQNNRGFCYTGIDNEKDKPILKPFPTANLIIGNSNEVYNQIEDNSQHLLFVDGNHSFPMTISDFFCYESKVKLGGYFCFHDTGKHIKPFKDFQRMGSDKDPDMYISCRKALDRIGAISGELYGWRLIFDEADETNEAGGITVFKKLY